MAIHEKSLIEPERLLQHDSLVVDGVDVSGHWNTMIEPRTIRNYDDDFEKIIQKYGGGENVHRCWQCGSCTNSCTMYAQNVQFNPRYWIYLTRLGLKDEIIKDKDIIWQCVSCNKCTNICPKDVRPEGVMKALAHWLEEEGITDERPSTTFDHVFWEQIHKSGRIEDSHVMMDFFKKTKQPLIQEWLKVFMMRMIKYLPVAQLMKMGLNTVFTPKTKSWGKTGEVLAAYVREQKEAAHG
ncbi:MAG: 4Fe-4S dicluster domain-containing protein [Gammaproteobacteria bacterium]|jgi:heterodisulfide reductase subunit C2